MTVGPTSEEELEQIINGGGRRGEIYRDLKELRDRHIGLIREKYPQIPRRVSGYNFNELLPENGFNVARALVGTEGTCVAVLEATVNLIPQRPERTLVVLGYPVRLRSRRPRAEIMQHQPVGLEGIDDNLVEYMKQKGSASQRRAVVA